VILDLWILTNSWDYGSIYDRILIDKHVGFFPPEGFYNKLNAPNSFSAGAPDTAKGAHGLTYCSPDS